MRALHTLLKKITSYDYEWISFHMRPKEKHFIWACKNDTPYDTERIKISYDSEKKKTSYDSIRMTLHMTSKG